jgi:solute carrier family 25 (mitochondrial oxoglutarate transporter), member 11
MASASAPSASGPASKRPITPLINFSTAGLGGLIGWCCVHPFNTLSIRMNLATASGGSNVPLSFFQYSTQVIQKDGPLSLYTGLGAGLLRQLFYATARFGFFEVFRDELAKYRETDFISRMIAGVSAGGNYILLFLY